MQALAPLAPFAPFALASRRLEDERKCRKGRENRKRWCLLHLMRFVAGAEDMT